MWIDADAAGLQERDALVDRFSRLIRGELHVDRRRRPRRQIGQALVVEGGDRAEARVTSGDLSPAGAGLVDLVASGQ
ncbi:MAG: hypothetical protein A3H36_09375 [Chloroflexi bacterium RIFCSPLOWO2_02_FULL_71_16]|nr:MAG: hypothetical protein A3H36_09375 [Chloroflexi bacterium RIFCSPLOWO2_02_FULL_71_16]